MSSSRARAQPAQQQAPADEPSAASVADVWSSPQRKVLRAHSGLGGGVRSPASNRPIRRAGPPGTQQPRGGARSSSTSSPGATMGGTMGKADASSPAATQSLLPTAPAGADATGDGSLLPLQPQGSAEEPVLSDKQSLCIDLLVAGHVNSFVDFFYLTHRAEDSGPTPAAAASQPPPIAEHKLLQIQQLLTSAERAHRRGDSEAVYAAYESLAQGFHSAGDWRTAVYYYEKSLDLAESMEDLAQQCSANLNLGLTHDAMGDTAAAIRFHEKHLELARALGSGPRVQTANQQLVEAYRRYAEEHERKDDSHTAVLLYKRCLAAAQEAGDLRSEGLATYRLGVACANLGDRNESIEYQQKYLHICKRIGDQLGEGAACAALAHSFKELGQTDLAVSYLEKYQAIAQRNKQSVAQAEACAALGSIHSNGGEHHQAVHCFEKTFDIARTVGDRKLIDSARINLGMARGNLSLENYMGVVQGNLPALLNWKTRRQAFKQT